MVELKQLKELVEELAKVSADRDALQIKVNKFETRKSKRKSKSNPDESKFLLIMSNALKTLRNQVYQDAATHNLIVRKKITESRYSEYQFFSKFNQAVSRLLNYQTFVKECEDKYNLAPEAVAQHIVLRGEKAVNKVFKNGLAASFGEADVRLMGKRVFSEEELELTQYEPKSHEEEVVEP